MKKLSPQQAGSLGEMLALAKLNSLAYAAYVSPEGAPGHDLMVMVGGRALSIEVKTRQFVSRATEITRWPVDMSAKAGADYFLFVKLDIRTPTPTFYLLSKEQAEATHHLDSSGNGNCYPARVRETARLNDFGALEQVSVAA